MFLCVGQYCGFAASSFSSDFPVYLELIEACLPEFCPRPRQDGEPQAPTMARGASDFDRLEKQRLSGSSKHRGELKPCQD